MKDFTLKNQQMGVVHCHTLQCNDYIIKQTLPDKQYHKLSNKRIHKVFYKIENKWNFHLIKTHLKCSNTTVTKIKKKIAQETRANIET